MSEPTEREVELHKDGTGGPNDRILIVAGDLGGGRAPWQYFVKVPDLDAAFDRIVGSLPLSAMGDTDCLTFAHKVGETLVPGLTNEAVLAVVLDRLDAFQDGPDACVENDLARGHVQAAVDLLRLRTLRRAGRAEKAAAPAAGVARVEIAGASLRVGVDAVMTELLRKSWAAWSLVEDSLRRLAPPATPGEWAVLDALATTPEAKNGLAEVRSALARSQ